MALPEKFADELIRIISEDLALSVREMESIESACGAGDTEALARVLDEPGPDRDLVLALAFAPAQRQREALEPLLADREPEPGEEEEAAALAASRISTCRLTLPCGGRLSVEAPGWALAAFVKGLGLDRTPPPELRRAAAGLAPSLAPAALVSLRDAPRPWTGPGASFIGRLLEKGLPGERQELDALSFACSLLSELGPGRAPEDILFRKAAWARKHLAAAAREPDAPFELRTALGLRSAYVDQGRMERTLRLCEFLARSLFGPGFAFPLSAPREGEALPVDVASFLAMGRKEP